MNNHFILGIETSGLLCSVAWWRKGEILLEYNIEQRNAHSIVLAEMIKKGHTKLGIDSHSISLLAVSSGPGSFTGLRIGMAYAKGFCLGHDIPLAPITNFDLLAALADDNEKPVYTLISARHDLYYTGVFTNKHGELKDKYLADKNRLISEIPTDAQIIVHEENNQELFKTSLPSERFVIEGAYSASMICNLAYQAFLNKTIPLLDGIEPLYLQAFAGVV
jgi:tRNA threonylcarbamoyl adenosine modification protein YeaZ